MTILNTSEAGLKLSSLIDEAATTHRPIFITGKTKNAVLVSEEDWNSISETLNLLSFTGMADSIKEGMEDGVDSCSEKIDW